MSYSDIFLIENAFISSNKSIDFRVLSKQSIDNIMASWTLPAVEANSNLYLFLLRVVILAKGNDLMPFL